jgi:superfamily II DNA or RNA helicase
MTPFHALYTARELSAYSPLTAAYASTNIEVYPYQVAAAMFAMRSTYLKGVVLADEGSLGKTYEALLIISQLYFEGRDRILIIVPTPLLGQWAEILENCFTVPFECGFAEDSVALITYEQAVENAEFIEKSEWNMVVFDEAHRLGNHESKTARILKEAVGGAYKLLLTATPMQNSIMDLYGLIEFIDTGALGDADEFYKRYFRKPERYGELAVITSRYCFRTLRSLVEGYVKIPNRITVTADYPLSDKEVKLATMVDSYLKKSDKLAFPKMEEYDLTLMFNRALSSSPWALAGLADTACGRVSENELVEMAEFAAEIQPKDTGKGRDLLKALKIAFTELKKRGANRKTIIFTENRSTIGFLHVLLSDKYKTLAFDGSKSSDYSVIKKFKHGSENAEILIATNIAAEGFNLEFCSFIVNFDLPYNVLALEQRIMRCHRQGQLNDVVVLNFLNKQNFADVRMLELINKRVSQFDGIVGMSDDVVGNFCDNAADGITAAFGKARHKCDIESAFQATLTEHELQNIFAVQSAENALFTTFTRDIADKITITPQYIKDRTAEINGKLWKLTKWFFSGKSGYDCIDESRTVKVGITPQKVFTGAALRRREYSMSDRTLTLTSAITRNMLNEIYWQGIPDSGTVVITACEPCRIAFYQVKVKTAGSVWGGACYNVFVGETADGERLSDSDCCRIMDLPVVEFTATGESYGIRDGNKAKPPNPFDELICVDEYIRRAVADTDDARSEEIAAVTEKSQREKSLLNREVESLKNELRQIENALTRTSAVTERVAAEKRKATASRELKKREQSLFMDSMRVDVDLEEQIKAITEQANLTAVVERQFVIKVEGRNV